MITVTIEDAELAAAAKAEPVGDDTRDALLGLCRKEVDSFDRYLRRYGKEYAGGLSAFERRVVEGYIYQKLRGHVP